MRKITILSLLLMALMSTNAWAHALWVNAYESFAHPPGHALVTLGFGHGFPLDDLLAGDFGNIQIDAYDVITPTGEKHPLSLPDTTRQAPKDAGEHLTVESGDLGIRKIQFKEGAPEGTYQISAVSKPSFFTQYKDKDGKQKTAMQPMDQIKDLDSLIFAVKFESFVKSMFSYKKSTEPKPLGMDLEITPRTDVSDLHVGDLLPINVTFMGKPLSLEGTDIQYVTASSNTFGGPDGFSLFAYLMDGKAQFRMPAAGQWLVTVNMKRDVNADPALADLKGKTQFVWYTATLNVNVKP